MGQKKMTEGRSARDQPKQSPAKKKDNSRPNGLLSTVEACLVLDIRLPHRLCHMNRTPVTLNSGSDIIILNSWLRVKVHVWVAKLDTDQTVGSSLMKRQSSHSVWGNLDLFDCFLLLYHASQTFPTVSNGSTTCSLVALCGHSFSTSSSHWPMFRTETTPHPQPR